MRRAQDARPSLGLFPAGAAPRLGQGLAWVSRRAGPSWPRSCPAAPTPPPGDRPRSIPWGRLSESPLSPGQAPRPLSCSGVLWSAVAHKRKQTGRVLESPAGGGSPSSLRIKPGPLDTPVTPGPCPRPGSALRAVTYQPGNLPGGKTG